jgi:hypothetical protein
MSREGQSTSLSARARGRARPRPGAGNYRVTAAATLVLAETLLDPARHDCARCGCFEPQELFSLPELEADLRQRGLAVNPAT